MIKIANFLIALSPAGALSLAGTSTSLAKAKVKAHGHHAKMPSYQYTIRTPEPVVRCTYGVWDPYGLRCDTLNGR